MSAGDVDGKSVVCNRKFDNRVLGFRFIDGNVVVDGFKEVELKYLIKTLELHVEDRSYKSSHFSISWFSYWVLDRKTLELTSGRDNITSKYQCEVFESFDEYHDKLLEILPEKQKELDKRLEMQSEKQKELEEELKKNKI